MKRLLVLIVLLLGATSVRAADVFYANASAGSNNGTSCANAFAIRDATNGINTVGKWAAGNTLHICGTITCTSNGEIIVFAQADGSNGSPVTVKFETGAVLTCPLWGAGTNSPIVNHHQWVVIDGGTNGTIQNTANGSGLANNANTGAVFTDANNVTIKNLIVATLCQHTLATDITPCTTSGNQPYALNIGGGSCSGANVTVQNNTISDTFAGVFVNECSGTQTTNILVQNNTISRMNWGVGVGLNASGTPATGTITIRQNDISSAVNWDENSNSNHHNAIFLFEGAGGVSNGTYLLDKNFIHGDFGVNDTSYIFIDPNGGTVTGVQITNNILANTAAHGPGNGYITGCGTNNSPFGQVYNNTIVGNSVGQSAIKTDSPCVVKNNVISTVPIGISVNTGTTLGSSDNNVFFNLTGGGTVMNNGATNYGSVAAWTSGTGFDTNSQITDPKLNADFTLQAGSSAIGHGANLSGLGISALNTGAPQTFGATGTCGTGCLTRGSTWDIGPYPFTAGGGGTVTPAGGFQITAYPLPADPLQPVITSVLPTKTYVSSKGCTQDAKNWKSPCVFSLTCSANCSATTQVSFDGTPVTQTYASGVMTVTVPTSLIPVPTTITTHNFTAVNPTVVPLLAYNFPSLHSPVQLIP